MRFDFGSILSSAAGSCSASMYVDETFRGNAQVSASGGTSLIVQLTKGTEHGVEFRNFSCTADNRNLLTGAQYTDLVLGVVRLQNFNQTGIRSFVVN